MTAPLEYFIGEFNGAARPDVISRTSMHSIQLLTVQDDTVMPPVTVYQGDFLSDAGVGDFDGDGDADIVASDTATNSLIVLLSHGDGTFDAPIVSSLPIAPSQIVAGDFDEDGKNDLFIYSYSASVLAFYRGDGTGHFSEISRIPMSSAAYQATSLDVDHDGHKDIVFGTRTPIGFAVYFGNGNGTFAAPVLTAGAGIESTRIIAADLDGDGDSELLSCEFNPNTVTVVVNLGSRSFAPPVTYTIPSPYSAGNPDDLVVGEVNGDGYADVVVTLANMRGLGTLPGLGNGALGDVVYSGVPQTGGSSIAFPHELVLGDFTGDSRLDLLVGTGSTQRAYLMANSAGEAVSSLWRDRPTISVGQTETFTVEVYPNSGFTNFTGGGPPATGNVTLKSGASVVGTGTFSNGVATIELNSLPVGMHSITAVFDGDANYGAVTSPAVAVHVVSEQTIVTLSSSNGPEVGWGNDIDLQANATFALPGYTFGSFRLYVDGIAQSFAPSGPPANWGLNGLAMGSHSFYVEFEGNSDQPPATSNTLTRTVVKGTSTTTIEMTFFARAGEQPQLLMPVKPGAGSESPTGTVRLYEGATLVTTAVAALQGSAVAMPALTPGVHFLRATYDGDSHYLPSQSDVFKYTVVPNDSFAIVARIFDGHIDVQGRHNIPNVSYYRIYRRLGNDSWLVLSSFASQPYWTESLTPQPNTTYAYRMEAYSSSNQLLGSSNVDLTRVIAFTDDPIDPSTPIKAVHIQELLAATNTLRAASSLAPITLPNAVAGQPIRASHMTSLISALNDGLVAIGAAPVTFSPSVTVGSAIRVPHIQDLREALH